jgi:ribosomal protein S18 acetylase RimI-like enzyme
MALAEPFGVVQRGEWPGPISFRRGWARAEARRWNDAEQAASLRLVRGSAAFLKACTEKVHEIGASSVISPPLPVSGLRTWENAEYEHFMDLALMRISLDRRITPPRHLVVEADRSELGELIRIDNAAFSPFWRFDTNGLVEALDATGRSVILVIREADGRLAGFAIVGFGHAIAYLQRVAVHPDSQGEGMGRSLVRMAARRASSAGAKAMLLNTQFDNEPAIGLYVSEGFSTMPERLALVRHSD